MEEQPSTEKTGIRSSFQEPSGRFHLELIPEQCRDLLQVEGENEESRLHELYKIGLSLGKI